MHSRELGRIGVVVVIVVIIIIIVMIANIFKASSVCWAVYYALYKYFIHSSPATPIMKELFWSPVLAREDE